MNIVVEGTNGSGKTTLLRELASYMARDGRSSVLVREPGGTEIGESIRKILLDSKHSNMCDMTELMLFAAARAQLIETVIKPQTAEGNTVLSDRGMLSTTVFQHHMRGLPYELVSNINSYAMGGFMPDLILVLDIEPALGIQRVLSRGEGLDRMEDQDAEKLERVRNGYLIEAKKDPNLCKVIDASKSFREVLEEAIVYVDEKIAAS